MEPDALVIQSEQKLMSQAEELVVMVDSSKFQRRSSMILCPLERVTAIITDDGVSEDAKRMVEDAGVKLIIAGMASPSQTGAAQTGEEDTPSVA
jgi:DeoR family transcriptional regulator, ulaG and ulaABCDEF operon transcriptional repressor